MNWLAKLFKPKPVIQSHRLDAVRAFATGKQIWQDAVKIEGEGWHERRLPKIEQALTFLDEAIEKVSKEQVTIRKSSHLKKLVMIPKHFGFGVIA